MLECEYFSGKKNLKNVYSNHQKEGHKSIRRYLKNMKDRSRRERHFNDSAGWVLKDDVQICIAVFNEISALCTVKPIFRCDAKPFALGTGIGLDPQRHTFALPIPTCLYLKRLKICVTHRKPQRESVEYSLRWVPNAKFSSWPSTFHVFCVDFICVWWPTQTQYPLLLSS